MNKAFAFIFVLGFIGCSSDNQESINPNPAQKTDQAEVSSAGLLHEEQFDIQLEIKQNIDQYSLAITLDLDSSCFVYSPFSTDSAFSHFEILVAENDNLILADSMVETPNSVIEFDEVVNEQVRVVRAKTTFTYDMSFNGDADFEELGIIEFVLEPRCVPYDVEFVISRKDGELEVQKTKTAISEEYKM
jgi:hypothetical protein